MRVCIYCASSTQIDPSYFQATEQLATLLVESDIGVVYGGGAYGLMGKLADVILEKGGRIRGIMPAFMNEVEWAHRKVTDFVFTETMHERKAKFLEEIDGIIALPGGSGTLEELLEAITLKRLGLFTKPIIILNTNNYYAPLQEMLDKSVEEKFMDIRHLQMWTFVNEARQVIDALHSTPEWDVASIKFASPGNTPERKV